MPKYPLIGGQRHDHYHYDYSVNPCPLCDETEPCECPKYRAEAKNLECERCGALMGQHLAAGPLLCPPEDEVGYTGLHGDRAFPDHG